MKPIVATTTLSYEGHTITRYIGIVRGLIVRTPSFGQGIAGAIKSIAGGDIEEYKQVCDSSRQRAFDEMLEHAAALGANAVIGVRFDATQFMNATEVLCYGTAVVVSPEPGAATTQ